MVYEKEQDRLRSLAGKHLTPNPSVSNHYKRYVVRRIFAYVMLWAMIFAVGCVLAEYSSIGANGSYPYTAGVVIDFVLPVAIGLVFTAIGVTVGCKECSILLFFRPDKIAASAGHNRSVLCFPLPPPD